jgi:hypothetical protein
MARERQRREEMPPNLAHFDPAEWAEPTPSETLEYGDKCDSELSAKGKLLAAHRRWARARHRWAVADADTDSLSVLLADREERMRLLRSP